MLLPLGVSNFGCNDYKVTVAYLKNRTLSLIPISPLVYDVLISLLSPHNIHWRICTEAVRTWMQAPTLDESDFSLPALIRLGEEVDVHTE